MFEVSVLLSWALCVISNILNNLTYIYILSIPIIYNSSTNSVSISDCYLMFPAAHVLSFMGGFGTIFTTGVWDFLICRFIGGLAHSSYFQIMYILRKYLRLFTQNVICVFMQNRIISLSSGLIYVTSQQMGHLSVSDLLLSEPNRLDRSDNTVSQKIIIKSL